MSVDEAFEQGPFYVEVVHLDGTAAVMLRGELDVATAPTLWWSASEVAAQVPTGADLVLDLSALEFIDAAGLGVVVRLRHALASRESGLCIKSPTPWTRRILEITGLDGLLRPPADPAPQKTSNR